MSSFSIDNTVSHIPAVQRAAPLKEQIYDAMRHMLTAMDFGQRIVERDLTEMLGVSRTPVREALARLSVEGYIVATGRGYRIPSITVKDIRHMTEIRALLECVAARQAAENTTDAGLALMTLALDEEQIAHDRNDAFAFNRANLKFREGWNERVENPYLLEALARTMSSLQLLRHRAMCDPAVRLYSLSSDRLLVSYFAAQDVDRAVSIQQKKAGEMCNMLIASLNVK